MTAAAIGGATRLEGHLTLVCGLDARGQSCLREQSFRAPFHLSKPFLDPASGTLVVNLVTPTAGLFDGDRLRVDVRVEPGARLLLTTPAATRVHTMRGGCAEVMQRFRVAAGGSLEWWPEPLIPQRGARLTQRTEIDLEPGAELWFFEALAPGRVAMGEAFAYDELRFATDLRLDGRLLARERFRLAPGEACALGQLRRRFPHAYYAGALLVSPSLTSVPVFGGDGNPAASWSAASALGVAGAFAFRLVAGDSVTFRRALNGARAAAHGAVGRVAPGLRRGGG